MSELSAAGLPSAVPRPTETRKDLSGFLEGGIFANEGIKLTGWASRKTDGVAPVRFVVRWGAGQYETSPTAPRPDVGRNFGVEVEPCGFNLTVPWRSDIDQDWTIPSITAIWADGHEHRLEMLNGLKDGPLGCLGFSGFEEFQRFFQNPSFRIQQPVLQAYGAARALRLAGDDADFWMAGAVVALYRSFEDGVFPRRDAAAVIARWNGMKPALIAGATGKTLRWATSMHLAAGYAHLAWGEMEQAREQFAALPLYADRVKTWPQATTNLGIGIFIAAWLEWRRGDIEAAKACLVPATQMFQAGTGVLNIWNWHMFEELRSALRLCQMCFSFLKILEGEKRPHVIPPQVTLKLPEVSIVLRRLIERGLLQDETLPRPAAQ